MVSDVGRMTYGSSSRALPLGFAASEEVEGRFAFLHDRGGHECDTGRVAHVDLVRREAERVRGGVRRGGGHRLDGRDRGRAFAEAAEGRDDGHDDGAAEQGGYELDQEGAFHVWRG